MSDGLTLSRLILREVQRAKANTLLCFATVVVATGVFITMLAVSRASVDATRILMKDLGFNLLITPAGVDPARYQALDFQDAEMPEDYVSKLARSTALAQHYVGKLQKTIQLDGRTVVLTGILTETPKQGTQKQPMPTAYTVKQGDVYVGSAAARALGVREGDALNVLGNPFNVARVLDEAAVIPDDIRVYADLHDVQGLLGKPGRINAIDALACQCPVSIQDIIGALERSIRQVLPDVNVQAYHSILLARHYQRAMMDRLALIALAIVMAGSASAIWGLTHLNVRNRRREIAVLRALGVPAWRIGSLFAGKILAYSLAGTAFGSLLGYAAAKALNTSSAAINVPSAAVLALFIAVPAAAMLFGLPPVAGGLMREPAEVLAEAEG